MADVYKIPGGGSTKFSLMIDDGVVYIDKSDLVAKLASSSGQIYFLTRPRRFGKTTLISTFKELFTHGSRRFANLKLGKNNLWHDSNTYNVLSLTFYQFFDRPNFAADFTDYLCFEFANAGIEIKLSEKEASAQEFPLEAFSSAFDKLEDRSLVLLIDEYDTPLNQVLHNAPEFKRRRKIMEQFNTLLKDHCAKFRFAFITGIGRFLDPGNLPASSNFVDISYQEEYAAITGFTQQEIADNLYEYPCLAP
ncbi:MAG: AAA family ATPase [Proteobacteria bacterium]|uniref:AAA family ATPase n=1 Tax=Candidatus Avisuccinivibrio stercorigallinarum TaxID=2840704 RepID=A0A9D9DC20_9GAMM|nr:AAA family ATPase [Candidatus Avisuccinivibrio stercorigallinarum]